MTRGAKVRALAKINLDLRVTCRRADGFHELRSIFHTISVGDDLEIEFTPGRKRTVTLEGCDIADNIAVRAAELLDAPGAVRMRLTKRIPMGAGCGGGSSDAAAVLLALPALAGLRLPVERLMPLAAKLGSDVPYFLFGGNAAAVGRGTELFPLAPRPPQAGLLVAPGVHVSTRDAYAALSPRLTTDSEENKIVSFQSLIWAESVVGVENDFEAVVFKAHPALRRLKQRLVQAGASPALMTGSGSALFGLFRSPREAAQAVKSFEEVKVFPFTLVSRAQYRAMWLRRLKPHITENIWPPQSRYAR